MNEQELLTLLGKHTWSIQGFNAMPLYLDCAASESGWITNKRLGHSYSHFFYLFSKGRAQMYYDEADWERGCVEFYKNVRTIGDLEALEKKYGAEYEKRRKAAEYDAAVLATLGNAELVELIQRLFQRLVHAVSFAHVIEGVTFGSERRLKKALARVENNETEFSVLCSPVVPSFLSEAQQRLWEIRNSGYPQDLIETYIRDFGWVQTTYLGPRLLSPADVRAQAETMPAPSGTDYVTLLSEKRRLIEKYGLTEEEQFMVHAIERCFAWQDDRKKNILQSIFYTEPALMEISKRFGIELMPLKFASFREFTLDKLTSEDFKAELYERCKKSAFYVTESEHSVFTGDAFDVLASSLHVHITDDVTEIRGVIASKGKVTGRVKVCESVSDIDKCQEGDVLVASMTRPEYLTAMQKAVAFVTNEGGLTCHAAIIAREMGKPCIIGTKVATQVLKDGDMVEVDAEKGIVKKL